MSNIVNYKTFEEICVINPKKNEIKNLDDAIHVSFIPMSDLHENQQNLVSLKNKALNDVYSGYSYFKNDDVILAKVTPCFENGKAGIAKDLTNGIGFGSSEFHVLRPKEIVDSKWIYYALKTESFKTLAKLNMNGAGGLRRVPVNFIKTWKIFVPSLEIQKKTLLKLDKIFEKIDLSINLIKENIEATQRLINSTLDKEFEKLELKYKKKLLSEIVTVINGRAYKKTEMLKSGKYPILRVGNFFSNRDWYYSDMELEESKYCEKGDLLYAWSASFGPRIWEGEKSIYHYHIWKIVPKSKNVSKFFLYYLLERDTDKIKQEGGRGVGMIHITKAEIEKRMIVLPPLDVQQVIVSKLQNLFEYNGTLVNELQVKLKHMEKLKSSLLDQTFKGEL